MPERDPDDGPVSISRPSKGLVQISCSMGGEVSSVVMSEHNAWRILAMLSVLLELPLSKAAQRAIKL